MSELTKEYIESLGWELMSDRWQPIVINAETGKQEDVKGFQFIKNRVRLCFYPHNFLVYMFEIGEPLNYTLRNIFDGTLDNTEDFISILVKNDLL